MSHVSGDGIMANYNMAYHQQRTLQSGNWRMPPQMHVEAELAMKRIVKITGFNSVYMMWFWCKGSKAQIRQLTRYALE